MDVSVLRRWFDSPGRPDWINGPYDHLRAQILGVPGHQLHRRAPNWSCQCAFDRLHSIDVGMLWKEKFLRLENAGASVVLPSTAGTGLQFPFVHFIDQRSSWRSNICHHSHTGNLKRSFNIRIQFKQFSTKKIRKKSAKSFKKMQLKSFSLNYLINCLRFELNFANFFILLGMSTVAEGVHGVVLPRFHYSYDSRLANSFNQHHLVTGCALPFPTRFNSTCNFRHCTCHKKSVIQYSQYTILRNLPFQSNTCSILSVLK